MNMTSLGRNGWRLSAAAGLTILALVAGCASTPPEPTANLQGARQAISNAEQAEAGQYAAAQLGAARTKLSSADAAVKAEQMTAGARLADESRAEAELASALTASAKAQAVNEEMKTSTATLIQEMQRSGAKQ